MNEHDPRIREVLDTITPNRDAPKGLLAGARRKRQQRQAVVGGVAALFTVALMVPAASWFAQDNITANPAATETPVPEVFTGLTNPCLEEEQPTWAGSPTAGAERVWLCGDFSPGEAGNPWGAMGPLEPLVGGVDDLVTAWENFEPLPANSACTMEYTLAYTLVFDYADGTQRNLRGELHGCRTTSDGQDNRQGGQELFDLALTKWNEQREAYPELVNPYRACMAGRSIMGVELSDVTRGAVCAIEGGFNVPDGEVLEGLVADIRDSLLESASQADPAGSSVNGTGWSLELANQFADTIRLNTDDGQTFEWWADSGLMRWEAPPELAEAIAAHLEMPANPGTQEPSNPDPVNPPEVVEPAPQPFLPEECTLTGDGVFTSPLETGEEPTAIWLCPVPLEGLPLSHVPPIEPLTVDTGEAVGLLRDLEPLGPDVACTADLGITYTIVHTYADGSQRVVQFEDFGCHGVTVDGEQLGGGGQYFEELHDLWRSQRAASEAMHGRPGPLCPELHSTMGVDHTERFIGGSACLSADGEVLDQELDPDLAFTIHAALQDAQTIDVSEMTFDGQRSLVLLTAHGDPFTLQNAEGSTWVTWSSNGQWLGVTFPDELQARVDGALAG